MKKIINLVIIIGTLVFLSESVFGMEQARQNDQTVRARFNELRVDREIVTAVMPIIHVQERNEVVNRVQAIMEELQRLRNLQNALDGVNIPGEIPGDDFGTRLLNYIHQLERNVEELQQLLRNLAADTGTQN